MKKLFKVQYDKVIDKIRANIATVEPYFENMRKVSISLSLKLALVVIAVFSVIWLGNFAWKRLTDQDIFLVSPKTFSFETPDWATDEFIHEINNIHGLKRKYNIFEKDLTKKIVDAYESSPLISKVNYVERELPNKLKMKFELRRPVAIVKRKLKKYLVDKKCVRIPEKFYKYPEEGDDPIYIVSRRSVKVPEYGEKWNDRSIEDGMNLLNYLKHNEIHKLLKIASIDVSKIGGSRKDGKIDVELWTKNGAKIKWGCSASSGQVNEPSNYEKLQNLLSVAKEEGADLTNMEYVDVTWKTPLAKRISLR
ncbi:MAG: cell division protein FtsQ/DivIB [Planctomycetota bacterium]|jgi:cell division septal protein FtsQ